MNLKRGSIVTAFAFVGAIGLFPIAVFAGAGLGVAAAQVVGTGPSSPVDSTVAVEPPAGDAAAEPVQVNSEQAAPEENAPEQEKEAKKETESAEKASSRGSRSRRSSSRERSRRSPSSSSSSKEAPAKSSSRSSAPVRSTPEPEVDLSVLEPEPEPEVEDEENFDDVLDGFDDLIIEDLDGEEKTKGGKKRKKR